MYDPLFSVTPKQIQKRTRSFDALVSGRRGDAARSVLQDAAKETRDVQGTTAGSGLGLSIVQWIAHAHGGEVRVHSEVGRGSLFEVWLPLLDDKHTQGKHLDL